MRYEGEGALDKAITSSKTGEAFVVLNPDGTEITFDSWTEAETYRHEPYKAPKAVVVKPGLTVEEEEARYKAQCEQLELARARKSVVFNPGEFIKPNLEATQQVLW